jgi:hypothetical protein
VSLLLLENNLLVGLDKKVSLLGVQDTFMVVHISPTWRTSLHVREDGNTSLSLHVLVISILEFTFLVIAIEFEVLISCYHLCYLYLVLILLSLS